MQSRKKETTEWQVAEIEVSYKPASRTCLLNNSFSIEGFLRSIWNHELIGVQEQVYCLFLSRDLRLIGWRMVSLGSYSASIVDVKFILSLALKCNSSALVIAHNHPSGSVNPSVADLRVTRELLEACNVMDIRLLDHIILSPFDFIYFSFADNHVVIPAKAEARERTLTGPEKKIKETRRKKAA